MTCSPPGDLSRLLARRTLCPSCFSVHMTGLAQLWHYNGWRTCCTIIVSPGDRDGQRMDLTCLWRSGHGLSKYALVCNVALMYSWLMPHQPSCRHLAAAEGQLKTVEWLLKQECDPNPIDRFSRTPLDVSSSCPCKA